MLFWLATMAVLAAASAVAQTENSALLVGVVTVPATFVLTLLFLRWERASLSDYGFDLSWASCGHFGMGLLIGFALVGAHTSLLALGGGVHWVRTSGFAASNLLTILAYLLLATREELAFRGYPLRKLALEIDWWVALIIVSVLFTVEHRLGGATWTNAFIGSGMGSLVFGMAALATRGLALPIGLHAAWNVGDWARGGKEEGGLWRMVVDPASVNRTAVWAMLSYVLVMVIAFAGLWLCHRRTQSGRR
nr:CPBP family intramembrane metalloprotease [Sphingomonas sp.]